MSRRKLWSHTVGSRPNRVTVTELERGGNLYVRVWDAANQRRIERSLRHKDRERAKAYAARQHAKLMAGEKAIREGHVTLSRLFTLYAEGRTPRKSESEQRADKRRFGMWLRVLGPETDAHAIPSRAWERFIDDRRSGAIDAHGRPVPEEAPCPDCGKGKGPEPDCGACGGTGRVNPRREVRARTVEADCLWLRWVLGWGVNHRTGAGTYLLRENCVRGFEVPTEKNPARPVATTDRYEAIREHTDGVMMECRWEGKRQQQRSWLSEVFDLAMATGRRISSVCELRADDLMLDRGPFGYVRWRAETDKTGRESVVPIDADARAALDRQLARRAIVGAAYLFPSPTDPAKPMTRHLADQWLRRAEELAGVEPQPGTLWHAYRRMFAVARKDLPDADVAKLGGWKGTDTLRAVYQQADEATMLEIVSTRHELREARG